MLKKSSFLPFCLSLLFLIGAIPLVAQPVVENPSTSFTPADSSRDSLDVGGVWNGSEEVTGTIGDTFSVTYRNTGNAAAYDFRSTVALPAGFIYVGNSATVITDPSSNAAVTATLSGSLLTLDTQGYDLPAGSSITYTFGLYAETSVGSGTYSLQHSPQYALADGGALLPSGPTTSQNILVTQGETTVNVTPKQQERAIGETAEFTITVRNTGLGGLFDVTIDETSIYPYGNNLQFVGMTQTSSGLQAASSNGGAILTLPYLAAGDVFTADVTATVLSCGLIVNEVTSVNRVQSGPVIDLAPVQINLLQPLIEYIAPAVTLDYNDPKLVTIELNNTGLGAAYDFSLETTLPALDVTVADVATGWSYNAGVFTYHGNNGTIFNNETAILSFTLKANDVCTSSGTERVDYIALYENECGDPYSIPQKTGSVSSPANAPTISLSHSVSEGRIAVGNTGSYTITLSAENVENIADRDIAVFTELPPEIRVDSVFAPHSVPYFRDGIIWELPTYALSNGQTQTLVINFTVLPEPCNAGTFISANSTSGFTTTQGCSIDADTSAVFFASNNPGLFADQYFDVIAGTDGTVFQTGTETGPGQGDLIEFRANYEFSNGYPGFWTDSIYEDHFGGVSEMKLAEGSLVAIGSFGQVAVPSSAVTNLNPGIRIDLGFLASSFNDDNVSGREVTFSYQTTAPDASLAGDSTRAVSQISHLYLAGGSGEGSCIDQLENRFTQGTFYTLARASAEISLSMPSQIDVCELQTLTITVGNGNSKNAHNILATLLTGGSDYVYDASFSPVYGGSFSSANIDYQANGGIDPTFTYTGGALNGEGTIQVRVRRASNGNTAATPLPATVDFDSFESASAGNRIYTDDTSYTPARIRKANLAVTVTPGSLSVTSDQIMYVTYVTNTDAGVAFGAKLENTLPPGITIDQDATDAANPGYPVDSFGQDLVWDLGDLAPGAMVPIRLIADVGAISGCAIEITTERITASWGCGDTPFQEIERTPPKFSFPSGRMQIVHDTSQTVARLCDPGRVVIIVRNTGPTNILGVEVNEIIPPAAGFSIHNVEYRIDGGPLQPVSAPHSGDGSESNPYRWTETQIPELAELVPTGVPGTSEIRIEFDLNATEDLAGLSPVLQASGNAMIPCGSALASPARPFNIPVEQPVVEITKTGRNSTANPSGAFAKTVYGGAGDTIEWQLEIANIGSATANNLRLSDLLSQSGGTATISGPGHNATPLTSGQVIALPDLNQNETAIYTITEMLGTTCVTQDLPANLTWGCLSNGPNSHSNLSEPGKPTDSARIVMDPEITSGTEIVQTVTPLPGGRARIDVVVTNNGGNAHVLELKNTFPNSDIILDTSVDPTFNHVPTFYPTLTSEITGITLDHTDAQAPKFSFTTSNAAVPMLRYGDRVTLTFYVRSTITDDMMATTFPDLDERETSLDPAFPAVGNNVVQIDYKNSCGSGASATHSRSLELPTPDLDITAVGPNDGITLLTGTETLNYTFTITNVGRSGSIADLITADFPDLGSGWKVNSITLTTPGTNGTGGTISTDGQTPFTPEQFGTLGQNQSAVITVNAAYSGTPGPLTLKIRVRGEASNENGDRLGVYYSQDQRAQRIIGTTLSKVLEESSESTTNGTDVLVGEEVTYRLTATFFGLEDDITDLTIRETPANTSGQTAHTSLGYVSHSFTGNHTIPPLTVTAPQPVTRPGSPAASRIDFTATSLGANDVNSGNDTFETDLVLRVLNTDQTTHNKTLRSNLGVQFTYLGKTFRPNNSIDGFTGPGHVTNSNLHKQADVTVRRPTATLSKTVRNVTKNGEFSSEAFGEAGDELEFRLVVTNPSVSNAAPLFSITVEDELPAKLILLPTDAGADTNDTGSPDVPTAGIVGGDGGTISFTSANTPIDTAGSDLNQLDAGESVVLLYRATLAQSVNPSEILVNEATATGQTLLYPSGNQTVPLGDPDDVDGAAILTTPAASATVKIIAIDQQKTIEATSETSSPSSIVRIGEQIRYRISLQIPHGTVPDLSVTDTLPSGLALIGTPEIVIGNDLTAENDPPAFTENGQTVVWHFGEVVADGSDVTITIDYLTQVRNIPENSAGTVLTNEAFYNFTGLPNDIVNLTEQNVTIAEPDIAVSVGVRNVTVESGNYFSGIDSEDASAPEAGDILEFQISISNASGPTVSGAFDLAIISTLPDGLTYLPGQTAVDSASGEFPSGFQPGDPEISGTGEILTWGRQQAAAQNLDLAPGGSFVFHFQARVDTDSRPLQVYENSIVVDWSSLDGDPLTHADLGVAHEAPGDEMGERIGTTDGSLNTYRSEIKTTVIAGNKTAISKNHSDATLPLESPGNGFRIGDLITYILDIEVQEGSLEDFSVNDKLPEGLAFVETVSITPPTGQNGFTYSPPVAGITAPDSGDTTAISWEFGDLSNVDDGSSSDQLQIIYTARVLDENGIAAPSTNGSTTNELTNSATGSFQTIDSTFTTVPATDTIEVAQPRLKIEKEVLDPSTILNKYVARPGAPVTFRLTLENNGDGPAYNAELIDLIPVEMRDTAPQLIAATLNGNNILGDLQSPAWNGATGEWNLNLVDSQFVNEADPILPGNTLVLEYVVYLNDDAPKGKTVTTSAKVLRYFSKPEDDLVERREYAEVGPADSEIVIGLEITGFVYHDIDPNGTRDNFEDWSDGTRVFVNLVDPITNTTFRSIAVDPGEGDFLLTNIPPGDYGLVLAADSTATGAQAPSPWLFRTPPDGTRPVTLSAADRHNQDFGLYQGIGISGIVFHDDGSGSGNANDGRRNGSENPMAGITVRIRDAADAILDTTQTTGTGQFQLYVPEAFTGSELFIEATVPHSYLATGGYAGNSGGSYDRSTNRIQYAYSSGVSVSGIEFGMVPENALLTDGQQTILPGAIAFYRHIYTAGSAGTVTFSIANTSSPSIPWNHVIIRDANGDGMPDAGEPIITDIAIPVGAGEEIHLIVKVSSPSGAPYGATDTATITADFNYVGASPALEDTRTRQNVTTIGDHQDSGLQLIKEVDTTSALPGATLTYTIRYTNAGTEPLSELVIYDRTPHYTTFVEADTGPAPLPDSLTNVTIQSPASGEAGAIVWTFGGELEPGASGTVTFKVKLAELGQ